MSVPEPTAEVVRAQEQLAVRREWVPVERVRVARRVVTETRRVEVSVRREELHVERVPIEPEAAGSTTDRQPAPAPIVLVLREEVPVVTLATQPVERVRVSVDTVTGLHTVQAELRREEVAVDAPERGEGSHGR